MKYELTFKNKLYLIFHKRYVDRMSYLLPKVEEHIIKYFDENKMSLPFNFYKYVVTQTQQILFEFDNL